MGSSKQQDSYIVVHNKKKNFHNPYIFLLLLDSSRLTQIVFYFFRIFSSSSNSISSRILSLQINCHHSKTVNCEKCFVEATQFQTSDCKHRRLLPEIVEPTVFYNTKCHQSIILLLGVWRVPMCRRCFSVLRNCDYCCSFYQTARPR